MIEGLYSKPILTKYQWSKIFNSVVTRNRDSMFCLYLYLRKLTREWSLEYYLCLCASWMTRCFVTKAWEGGRGKSANNDG